MTKPGSSLWCLWTLRFWLSCRHGSWIQLRLEVFADLLKCQTSSSFGAIRKVVDVAYDVLKAFWYHLVQTFDLQKRFWIHTQALRIFTFAFDPFEMHISLCRDNYFCFLLASDKLFDSDWIDSWCWACAASLMSDVTVSAMISYQESMWNTLNWIWKHAHPGVLLDLFDSRRNEIPSRTHDPYPLSGFLFASSKHIPLLLSETAADAIQRAPSVSSAVPIGSSHQSPERGKLKVLWQVTDQTKNKQIGKGWCMHITVYCVVSKVSTNCRRKNLTNFVTARQVVGKTCPVFINLNLKCRARCI